MATIEQITANISDVTSEQIGRCSKVIDLATSEDFYLVENESGECDEHGTIEYAVRYDLTQSMTCTCKSGQAGFCNVRHASGVCKHVRWALAAWKQEQEAEKKAKSIESQVPAWAMR